MKNFTKLIILILFIRLLRKDKLLRKVAENCNEQCDLTLKYINMFLTERAKNVRAKNRLNRIYVMMKEEI